METEAFPERFAIDSAHLKRQREWSSHAFGPAARVGGVSDHIRKELIEVATAHKDFLRARMAFKDQWDACANPGKLHAMLDDVRAKHLAELSEWVDLVILAFDGALRSGADPQEILDAVRDKQVRNEARRWPDWRTMSEDEAIEHVRDEPGSPEHNVLEPDPLAGKENFRGVPVRDCAGTDPHPAHVWRSRGVAEDASVVCYGHG